MSMKARSCGRVRLLAAAVTASAALAGCGEPAVTAGVAAGVAGTVALGSIPGPELKQVFYVGSFDPQGQLSPEVYRITVRGQGSLINQVKFASGWVPAGLADSLSSDVSINSKTGDVRTAAGADQLQDTGLGSGRRLVMFGPDGFRVAPRDHRLVIAMGSDADDYFEAIDMVLGDVARLRDANSDEKIGIEVLRREQLLDSERDLLTTAQVKLQRALNEDLQARLTETEKKVPSDGGNR